MTRGIVLKFIWVIGVSVLLLVAVGIGLVAYQVKKTQWRTEDLKASIKTGDRLDEVVSSAVFLEKAMPTGLSGIWVYSDAKSEARCMSMLKKGGDAVSVYDGGTKSRTDFQLAELHGNTERYRKWLGGCSSAMFTVMGGLIPYRGILKVHYDKNFIVTGVEEPYFTD
ncbi:MAG: hypothetical protein OEV59_07705 [Deltaproteobacteria bacterium]|nr:hypothetical protein [Deltaproteobacteria bacterium]